MALELLSKKVSCKYKHNSSKETLSCLLIPFHLPPPPTKHAYSQHPHPVSPTSNGKLSFSCSEQERPLHQRAFQQRPLERRQEAFLQAERGECLPSDGALRHVFSPSVLNFRRCPPMPLPTASSLPPGGEERPKQQVTTHPAE